MPHNKAADITYKQNEEHGRAYWDQHLPGIEEAPAYVARLKEKGIPIHTLYLAEKAEACFSQISTQTDGQTFFLDVSSAASADKLVEVVNVQILKCMDNPDLLESYKQEYGLQFS